eukprot:674471-Prymnesium_polylepis.1
MASRWSSAVARYLAHLDKAHLDKENIDAAEAWAANSSMFQATASWRLKVVAGVPWLRLIRVHSHWAERANVLRCAARAARKLEHARSSQQHTHTHIRARSAAAARTQARAAGA